jgi:hypothetical protein
MPPVSRSSRASGATTFVRLSVRLGRATVAAALCAQATHVVVYGSLLPTAGAHGYLTWYLPVLAVLSIVALVLVPASLAANASGRRFLPAVLPERAPGHQVVDVARLTFSSGAFLLAQESLERSVGTGGLHIASFEPFSWLILVFVLVLSAAAVVAIEHTLDALADRLTVVAPGREKIRSTWASKTARPVRRHPLSLHRGLRAPPLAV